MGLFDLPAPLFLWVDGQLGSSALLRLLIWGAVGGAASMLLYLLLSPQRTIANGKRELQMAHRALDAHNGSFEEAQPLLRRLLWLALRQVGRTGGPALLASLPVICLLAWLSNSYGYSYPAVAETPRLQTEPAALVAEWLEGDPPGVAFDVGERRVAVPLAAPVPLLHKQRWWNLLIGNPAGYLPDEAAAETIHIGLPQRHYATLGPDWLRGWMTPFFTALLAVSIALKVVIRIE